VSITSCWQRTEGSRVLITYCNHFSPKNSLISTKIWRVWLERVGSAKKKKNFFRLLGCLTIARFPSLSTFTIHLIQLAFCTATLRSNLLLPPSHFHSLTLFPSTFESHSILVPSISFKVSNQWPCHHIPPVSFDSISDSISL